MTSPAPALFLDRDGTLVEPRHYPTRADQIVLAAGIGPDLAALQSTGFRLVVITNQSGLARGYFTEPDLHRMHNHLATELAPWGVSLDAVYYCPHHPDGVVPDLSITCACRKPEPGLLLRAAADLDLDLRRSWFVGDILDDVEAGRRAGCRTLLVDLGTESPPTHPVRTPHHVARDTAHALRIIRALDAAGPPTDLTYLPARWSTQAVEALLAAPVPQLAAPALQPAAPFPHLRPTGMDTINQGASTSTPTRTDARR